MYLLLILVIFILIGYLLAESRLGKKIDGAAVDASDSSMKWVDGASDRIRSVLGIKSLYDRFDAWVNTFGASLLPSEFKNWYASLNQEEARDFSKSLSTHLKSLDLDLKNLVDGSIYQDPFIRQVFVETIVVYSQEFRKVKQAQEEVDQDDEASDNSTDEKKMAEKRSSRRKNHSNKDVDVYESASPA